MDARRIEVVYEPDGDAWTATSAQVPGYRAIAGSLSEARALVAEGIPFFLSTDVVPRIVEKVAGDDLWSGPDDMLLHGGAKWYGA